MFRRKLTALDYHNPSGFDCTGKNFNKIIIIRAHMGSSASSCSIEQVSKTGQNVESANLNR